MVGEREIGRKKDKIEKEIERWKSGRKKDIHILEGNSENGPNGASRSCPIKCSR